MVKNIARRWPACLLLLLVLGVTVAILVDLIVVEASVANTASGISENATRGGAALLGYGFYPEKIATVLEVPPVLQLTQFVLLLLCLLLPALNVATASAVVFVVASGLVLLHVMVPAVANRGWLWGVLICLAVLYIGYLILRWNVLSIRRRKVNYFLRQYIPSQLTKYYMSNPQEIGSVGDSRDMTILFCDIKRFTAISERLDPAMLPNWLNRYFDVVSEVVVRHGGTIDKYMGDSVMAFWGAPVASDTHAGDALRAAQEILLSISILSKQLVEEDLPPIAVGIGVSTGNANVGHLGSKYRMTYTVVGDAVNTADRLQRCTGFYDLPLIVNDAATESVPDYLFRELDTVHVKGRQRFVRIFQPICHEDDAIPNTHRQLQMHRKAMQYYRRGMWADAEALFLQLSEETQEGKFYQKYIDRLIEIQESQPKDGGSYVVDFTQKMG